MNEDKKRNKTIYLSWLFITAVTLIVFLGIHVKTREILSAVLFSLITSSLLMYFSLNIFLPRESSMLRALKRAIKHKEFYPNYQPIFDVQTGKYVGAEILLRWQNSENEIIMPDLFIIDAELHGIIVPITLQMMETVFEETMSLFQKFPSFYIAINLSSAHFLDLSFFKHLDLLMKKYAIASKQIVFEITERDLLDKNNHIFHSKMKELRALGFSLAIDDYGTGHASIGYLQDFTFDYLKIDELFIHSIGTKAITESLNDAIIHMAKNLNLTIIAEAVETEEQLNYLKAQGVQYVQGWYFSKALAIGQLMNLLKEKEHEARS